MANPGTLPVTLVTILLLVAPGYLAIRVFLRAAERTDTLDRTGKIVWSSAVSLASLLLLYTLSPYYFDPVADAGEHLSKRAGFVGGAEILSISLPATVILYTLHVSLLLIVSWVIGRRERRHREDPYSEREPWYYALTDLGAEEIGVLLQDGSRIDGTFVPAAWDPSSKDLVLEDPVRNGDGMRVPLGRTVLISSDNISAILFPDNDPNRATGQSVGVSEAAVEEIDEIEPTDRASGGSPERSDEDRREERPE